MSAQPGGSITLGYAPQGVQQSGTAILLSYSPPPGVRRRVASELQAHWVAAQVQHTDLTAPMERATPLEVEAQAPWLSGQNRQHEQHQPWIVAERKDAERAAPWGRYSRTSQIEQQARWVVSERRDRDAAAPWCSFSRYVTFEPMALWGVALPVDQMRTAPWGAFSAHLALIAQQPWGVSRTADATRWIPWLRFSRPLDADWGVVVPPGGIGPDEPSVIVPVRKVYIVINNVSLRRVDGNIPLDNDTSEFSLSLDADSWTWGFSASLSGAMLPNLEPGSDGAPVELEAIVNGTAFRVLVESITRDRTFVKTTIRVQGRGKTALLDSPYAPSRNFSSTATRTAQQLMADVLTVNNVPMPWVVDWRLTDWLVPGNVWAHQGSYISALNAIAKAAGGYIQPHASLQTLHVLPRYPVAPWDWAAQITPDFELPADVTVREGIEWVEKPRYDRVYVSGQQQGVLGQVTRAGTAGDLLAPMLTDALITHADAARQRGISVLSDVGRQANLSLSLPVLPETGIITPGKFVRYVDGSTVRLGIVRSTGVQVGFPVVRQTLGVQTYV